MKRERNCYELNTDEFYAYGYENELWSYMNFEIKLRDACEPERLLSALELAFQRFPYFRTKLSRKSFPGRRVLRRNTNPITIRESSDYPSFSNGYLVALGYSGKSLKLRISHILTDGGGAKEFIKALLIFYFQLKYEGKTADEICAEIPYPDTAKEYGNPYESIRMPSYTYRRNEDTYFSFDEDEVDDRALKNISFSVPTDVLLKFAKSQDSSVSAVIAWALIRAVYEVSPTSLPVAVAVPFDTRKNLGCEETLRNCNTTVFLRLSRDYLKYSNEMQLTALRAQLYLQMDDANTIPKMQDSYEGYLAAARCKTLRERTRFYHSGDNLDCCPIVSYTGLFDLGEYEPYYESMGGFVKVTGRAGVLLCAESNKGRIHFHVITNLKQWKAYEAVIRRILEENRIPVTDPTVQDA